MKRFFLISFAIIASCSSCFSQSFATGLLNGHGYVDLGLPSGTMWSRLNLGSDDALYRGDYYSWGELVTKESYTTKSYTHAKLYGSNEGADIGDDISGTIYDVAHSQYGGIWRMPTYDEVMELITQCKQVVWPSCVEYIGPNGNSITIPKSGYKQGEGVQSRDVPLFWCSNDKQDDAISAWAFYGDQNKVLGMCRRFGLQIRPVFNMRESHRPKRMRSDDAKDEFQVIKGDFHYLSNSNFNGFRFDGFADENNKPYLVGRISENENDYTIGQFQNGTLDGWMYMYVPLSKGNKITNGLLYSGVGKWNPTKRKCEPAGYGESTLDFTPGRLKFIIADESTYEKGGLAIIQGQKKSDHSYTFIQQGNRYHPTTVYKQLLYDNMKQYMKQQCQSQEIKYVEDVRLNTGYVYSGGWKDGLPHYLGAYYREGYDVVFYGNLSCRKDSYGQHMFYKGMNYSAYNINGCAYSTRKVKGSDTTYTYFNSDAYEEYTKNKNNEYVSFTQMEFSGRAGYGQILKPKSQTKKGKYWGICYYVNDNDGHDAFISLYEGYVGFRDGKIVPLEDGMSISDQGEVCTYAGKCENVISTYPEGSRFEKYREYSDDYNIVGIYTFPDKSYMIGYFTKKNGRDDKNCRIHGLEPMYTEEFDANNHLVNSIIKDAKWDTQERNSAIKMMKNDYMRPSSGFSIYKYNNGDEYSGEWNCRKREGEGILTQTDGIIYKGVWKNDLFVQGTITYPDGRIYKGNFSYGERNGQGKLTYKDGTYKEGKWKVGKFRSGTVYVKYDDGEYRGDWTMGKREGNGKYTYKNGGYKEGSWKKGSFISGEGYLVFDDGTTFKGIWEYGYPKEGTFTLADGTKISRTQTLKDQGGNHVPNLSMHVDIIYPDGREYHGPYRGTQLEGDSAVVLDGNGNRYEGAWDQYGRAGKGVNIFANGDSINTTWEYDVYAAEAEFIYTWSDGRKFVGMCDKKGKIGKGVYYHPDGSEASKKEYKGWEMQIPNSVETPAIPKVATSVPQ